MNLFTSYFISRDQSRQQEIDRCLSININNPNIKRIFLFLDCGVSIRNVVKNFGNKKLNFIYLDRRPTYEDWIVWSKTLDQQISVFANSDIYFDHTIAKLKVYLKKEKNIVCISRHNFQNNKWILHGRPEWSQDVWAIKYSDNINFSDQLNIKIGFPACDNRMACVFAMNGWNIFNPCNEIKCFHFHRSEHRDYKKYDPNSAGFLAFVPESNLSCPSKVTIIASPIKIENIKEVRLSNFLEKGLANAT